MSSETTVTTSFYGFREFFSETEGSIVYDREEERDLRFLNELCQDIHNLPTIEAAIKRTPDLCDVPIIGSYLLEDRLGRYSARGVEVNLEHEESERRSVHYEVQLTTLPHELRHGQQDIWGCLCARVHPRLSPNLEDQIFISRYVEADATAFSLTVMYEHFIRNGNYAPFERAAEIHYSSVEAYRDEIAKDGNAHWNGKAANAAFNAYFLDDNSARLKSYDLELCEEFARSAQNEENKGYAAMTMPKGKKMRLLAEHFRPMSQMPFVAKSGLMARREAYRPDLCGDIMNHLSAEAREMIQESKSKQRMLTLG